MIKFWTYVEGLLAFLAVAIFITMITFAFTTEAKGQVQKCTSGNEILMGYEELVNKLNLQEGQKNPYKYYRFTGETAKSALAFIKNNYNAQSIGFESIIMVYSEVTGTGYVGYFDDDTMNSCATTTFQVPASDIKALIEFLEGV